MPICGQRKLPGMRCICTPSFVNRFCTCIRQQNTTVLQSSWSCVHPDQPDAPADSDSTNILAFWLMANDAKGLRVAASAEDLAEVKLFRFEGIVTLGLLVAGCQLNRDQAQQTHVHCQVRPWIIGCQHPCADTLCSHCHVNRRSRILCEKVGCS